MNDYTPKFLARFWAKILIPNDPDRCWLWQAALNTGGYGHIRCAGDMTLAHRITYELTYGNPGDLHVLHQCDTPRCCNPRHLFLGTDWDNAQDRKQKGRGKSFPGETNGHCKLTDIQVTEIRRLFADEHISGRALSRMFKVSRTQIRRIILRHQRM